MLFDRKHPLCPYLANHEQDFRDFQDFHDVGRVSGNRKPPSWPATTAPRARDRLLYNPVNPVNRANPAPLCPYLANPANPAPFLVI